MQNTFILFVLGLLLTFLAACVSEPDYPDEPYIEYLSISKNELTQGDSLLVTISFTDGDGNLKDSDIEPTCVSNCAFDMDSSCYYDPAFSIFAIDMRDSCYTYLTLPDLEPEGDIKAISGELDIVILPFCKCSGSGCPSTEKTVFQIIIKDASNNYSNVVLTDSITVNCN